MLHGVVIFDSATGALIHQRRFRRHFGLPGAEKEPTMADPVSLALQLYAFNRFCGDLPGVPKLEYLQLGPDNAVFFAAAKPPFCSHSWSTAVLALFGDLPQELGQRIAANLLEAIVLNPNSSSAANRSATLGTVLDAFPDFLVGELAGKLPRAPGWLAVLAPEHKPRQGHGVTQNSSAAAGSAQKPLTPRPPAQPPPEGKRKSSFARRFVARTPDIAAPPMCAPATASAPAPPPKPAGVGAAPQHRLSWLHWRGRSRSATRSNEESTAPPEKHREEASPSDECLYFYSDGSSIADGAAAEPSGLGNFSSALQRANPCRTDDADVLDLSLEWPSTMEVTGVVQQRCAAVFHVGGNVTVAVPLQALLPDSSAKEGSSHGGDVALAAREREKNLVYEYRRALDAPLRVLAGYLDFLATAP